MIFKKSDRVRVKYFKHSPRHWAPKMRMWMGKEVKIKELFRGSGIRIENDKHQWAWRQSDFEKIDNEFLEDRDVFI